MKIGDKDAEKKAYERDDHHSYHYYSKHYKKYITEKKKPLDRYVCSCIGWDHVTRAIEVVSMGLRDLIYKIVPAKTKKRVLTTSAGKTLTKDSQYVLREERKNIKATKGNKDNVEYIFNLDLKEEEQSQTEEERIKEIREKDRKTDVFHLNLIDFNMFKLRSVAFLI